MRALCGAIITAGALIGLGLLAIGNGTRFQYWNERYAADHPDQRLAGQLMHVGFKHVDTASILVFALLVLSLLIGLGIAFFGLAMHHERRMHERELERYQYPAASTTPGSTGTRMPMT
jgi:hypothetical protein